MTPISAKHAQQDARWDLDTETDVIENAPAATSGNGTGDVDNGQRHELIATAAYFIAERRQFQNGSPEDDWLQAEAEIDRQLTTGNL